MPHTNVLRPVLAPALIPAADSGDIRMGGPDMYPLNIVVHPQQISKKLPRGIAPDFLVSLAKSERDRANPFNVNMYRNNKLKMSKRIEWSFGSP